MNLPRSHSKSALMTHPGSHKEPRTTSKDLQASLALVKVRVHVSTTRKKLDKNCLTFAKKLLNNHQDFWENILLTDETKRAHCEVFTLTM